MMSVRLATSSANSTENSSMTLVSRLPSDTRPSTLLVCSDAVALAISVPTPVPSSPQRKRKPTMMKLASSDEPPWLMKGSVMPGERDEPRDAAHDDERLQHHHGRHAHGNDTS